MKKDSLQEYLETVCKTQAWAKKIIAKPKTEVKQINRLSIMSVKQIIKK